MSKDLENNRTDAIKFVHITDTHLLDYAEGTFHGLNTKKSLELVLSESQLRYPDIDFLLFTGDISQTGTEKSYSLFRSVIKRHNLPVYCVPGNHDTPILLQRIIPSCPDDSINIVSIGKFSIVLINSWVENKHYGMVTPRCLQQLDEHLKNSEEKFNVIAIHHPPVLINSKWLDEIGLQNQHEFLQVINKYSRNSLLICGHVHQEIDQQLGNLRLLATPSTCHQYKANSDSMRRINTPSPAYRSVRLSATDGIDTKVHYIP